MSIKLTDEQIDNLLDADEQGDSANTSAIFDRIHERRRMRAHAKAKAAQPALGLSITASPSLVRGKHPLAPMETLTAFARAPITDEDASPGGIDYLCQTVQDCLDAGQLEDAVFAAFRVWRKAWAWNRHLGKIEKTSVKRD